MIRVTLLLLLLPVAAMAAEHEIQFLDAAGHEVHGAFSPAATCGDCHDPEVLEPHGPHRVDVGADCLQCHLKGALPEPAGGGYTVDLRLPVSGDCGTCHGLVVEDPDEPFFFPPDPAHRMTYETGAIFAPGRITRSGMNVASRDSLSRAWDVHAERLVQCTDCHSAGITRPSCRGCHDTDGTHDFLPEFAAHVERLTCQACHVPAQYGPTLATIDHTVLAPDGGPAVRYRGITGDPDSPETLVRAYRPVLLPRTEADGTTRLAPFNLITSWAWFDGKEQVAPSTLAAAFLDAGAPHPAVMRALDATGDGELSDLERAIFSPHQVTILAARLGEVGVLQPEIRGTIRRVPSEHGIADGAWATRDCAACHGDEAAATEEFWLADYAPAGVLPEPVEGTVLAGEIALSECGHVVFHAEPEQAGFDLRGTGPDSGLGRILRLVVALIAAMVAITFGTGPALRNFRRKSSTPSEGTR